jgi:hypothetical protein
MSSSRLFMISVFNQIESLTNVVAGDIHCG